MLTPIPLPTLTPMSMPTKPPPFIFIFNDKFNISLAVQFTRVGGGGFKCCFDVDIVEISLADVLGNIVKNPLILKKESDGKVSFINSRETENKYTNYWILRKNNKISSIETHHHIVMLYMSCIFKYIFKNTHKFFLNIISMCYLL
jgi:hypothetical protein